jgi:hypothetical protein
MYFDLEYTVRTDASFRNKLTDLGKRFQDLTKLAVGNTKYTELAQEKLLEILRLCRFNPAYLLPYYYPQYPKTEPMSLKNFPFAFHLLPINVGGYTVIRGSRQIAKSTTFAARQRLNAHMIPKFKSLYIAPKADQVKTYSNRLRELEQAFRFPTINHKFRQNLQYKEYPNGSTIQLINVDTQVSSARGMSTDELLYDEYQNFDPSFEPEIDEIQRASHMPVTLYAGTSLTTDTALEAKYAESSQGLWLIKCDACNHENIPTPEEGVMDMIQPKGVCCSKCGAVLDVTKGRFQHMNQEKFELGFYGFHIPQIIVPAVVNNVLRWDEIYRKKLNQDPRKFLQENLGIPTQEGEREITENDLRRICVLGDSYVPLHRKAAARQYYAVFSGCDWGGSDYDMSNKTKLSYTCHVVIGLTRDGRFDILHAKKYEGMTYSAIADDIMKNHNDLNGLALGADYGVGYAYNMLLRERMAPEQNMIFKYSAPSSDILKESPTMFNLYSLNRTESITALYYAIKSMRIRAVTWEKMEEYLSDMLNLIRVPQENNTGTTGFLYRKHGARSDDFLHALNFAYIVGRVFLQEPIVQDRALLERMKLSMTRGAPIDVNAMMLGSGEAFSM